MSLLFVVVGTLVIGGAFWIAAGRWDARLPNATHDLRPERRAGEPAFDVVVRGYRMDEVDATITDLQEQIRRLTAGR